MAFCNCLSLVPTVLANFAVPSLISSSLCANWLFSSLNILASSENSWKLSFSRLAHVFFNLWIGFDWRPDTIAFSDEKFFSTRNSYGIRNVKICTKYYACTNTWAILIQIVMIAARSCRTGTKIVLITRKDTALNWLTVAKTDPAAPPASPPIAPGFSPRLAQTEPRHWWGTSLVNRSWTRKKQ